MILEPQKDKNIFRAPLSKHPPSLSTFLFLMSLCIYSIKYHFSSVMSDSFVIPWIAAHQASLSITNFQSSLKLMSIRSVMPSNHLIVCHPFLLLPSIFPSIRVFSNIHMLHYFLLDAKIVNRTFLCASKF